MPREQLGVCAEGNLHSVYLMFNASDGVESQLRPCLANVAQYIYELSDQYGDSAFNGFIAVGANYWDSLYLSSRPAELKPFPAMNADNRDAPALEYDLFVHIIYVFIFDVYLYCAITYLHYLYHVYAYIMYLQFYWLIICI